jgi:hypothetical protein
MTYREKITEAPAATDRTPLLQRVAPYEMPLLAFVAVPLTIFVGDTANEFIAGQAGHAVGLMSIWLLLTLAGRLWWLLMKRVAG